MLCPGHSAPGESRGALYQDEQDPEVRRTSGSYCQSPSRRQPVPAPAHWIVPRHCSSLYGSCSSRSRNCSSVDAHMWPPGSFFGLRAHICACFALLPHCLGICPRFAKGQAATVAARRAGLGGGLDTFEPSHPGFLGATRFRQSAQGRPARPPLTSFPFCPCSTDTLS